MKKNGKRYRRLQKEKALRRQKVVTEAIEQEVDGINTANLCLSQIVTYNPIVKDEIDIRREYLKRIRNYLRIGGWHRRKYENSELAAYEKIILNSEDVEERHPISFYKYYILLDFVHMLGYETGKLPAEKLDDVKRQYMRDFEENNTDLFYKIINAVQGEDRKLVNLRKHVSLANEAPYINLIRKNVVFRKRQPFGIMVTATMSAGKSTFINALTGKNICLSQNMACTSKIHSITNKAFEDGYSYEYDHDLVLTAGKEELFHDNEQNRSDMIYVGTRFIGALSDSRIIVNDSPGVNFSGDEEHRKITNQLIKRRKYNLLIYVMNATQLGTNDEDEHLDYVKRTIGRTPVMFVMNKADSFHIEEEDVEAVINRQIEYLKKKGFKNPVVCPVSARAGYLAKRHSQERLSRSEERELYNYVDKFMSMNFSEYYEKRFGIRKVADAEQEEEQLIKTCGMAYLEKMIANCVQGGKMK
ncbi:MAG: hypothetical protein HFH49_10400 [Lachnospiraceae bacterium]|nr:hypothetical protein [Lachnospiraceae bacterium]